MQRFDCLQKVHRTHRNRVSLSGDNTAPCRTLQSASGNRDMTPDKMTDVLGYT